MRPRPSRWTAWALSVLAIAAALPAALLSVLALSQARLPYNEEGNHFDGLVVHHEGTAWVYGTLGAVLWVVALLAGRGARRLFKRVDAETRTSATKSPPP